MNRNISPNSVKPPQGEESVKPPQGQSASVGFVHGESASAEFAEEGDHSVKPPTEQ